MADVFTDSLNPGGNNRMDSLQENSVLDEDQELEKIEQLFCNRNTIDQGLVLLNQLASSGSTKAMLRFARLFEEDIIYKRDYEKEMDCLREADKLDDPEAAYQIGRMYRLGMGVKKDSEMAAYYFKKAARRGLTKAVYQAACASLECGRSSEGVKYLMRSINAGISEARYDYAICLLNGEGTSKDPDKALRILENCAHDGSYEAIERLEFMYRTGFQVPKDEKKSNIYRKMKLSSRPSK